MAVLYSFKPPVTLYKISPDYIFKDSACSFICCDGNKKSVELLS